MGLASNGQKINGLAIAGQKFLPSVNSLRIITWAIIFSIFQTNALTIPQNSSLKTIPKQIHTT